MFKNNAKTFLLFTLIFITAIGLSAVSAADTASSDDVQSTADMITKDVQTSTDLSVDNTNKEISKDVNKNIKREAANYTIDDTTYTNYFDSEGTLNNTLVENGSTITFSGDINNKTFTFDNIELIVNNDGTSTLFNTKITTQNGAKVTFDGLVIDNTNSEDYVILLESEGNVINNSVINVVNENPLHAIEVSGDSNTIVNTTLTVQAPDADVVYDKNWVGHPAASALYISSSNNNVEDSQVYYNATASTDSFPSADGIDIQSEGFGLIAENNTIKNTTVVVNGTNYVYGINVGRTKNTKVIDNNIEVNSAYYTNAIQLFDAENTEITGNITSNADVEGYAVYSTAMGTGFSKNINITADMNVDSKQATGVLIEGSSDITITDSTFNIKGENATATRTYVDWMGNEPSNFKLTNSEINVEGEIKNDVIYFGLCEDVVVDNNTIITTQRSNINVTNTSNASITNNYIVNNDTGIGDYAVTSNYPDTFVENNTPISPVVKDYEEQIEKLLNPDTVNTTIIITPIDAQVGQTINLTATITAADNQPVNGGKVVFKVNGQTVKDQYNQPLYAYVSEGTATASYTVPTNWAKENSTIEAVYSGDRTHESSRITQTDILNITKGTATITLDETEITAKPGENIKVVAKVSDSFNNTINGGKLLYKLNGITIATSEVTDGISVLTYTIPNNYSAKTYTLTVDYIAKYYDRTSTNATVTLEKKQSIITIDEVTTADKQTTLKATITDENGEKLVRNTAIAIKVDGKTAASTTSENGSVDITFDTNYKVGLYELLAISGENGIYKTSKTTTVLKIKE